MTINWDEIGASEVVQPDTASIDWNEIDSTEVTGDNSFDWSDISPAPDPSDVQAVADRSNWWGGWMSGLNESFTFNLAREGRALFDSETLMNNDWLFGRFHYGDKPWTTDVEEEGAQWMSVEEQMGVSPEIWDKMSHGERLKQLHTVTQKVIDDTYNPDRDSAAFMISNFAGMITDPTTAIALRGPVQFGAFGAVDASLYEHSTTGNISPSTPLIGATFGAAVGKAGQVLTRRAERKQSTNVVNKLQQEMINISATAEDGLSPGHIIEQAKRNLGLDDATVNKAIEDSGIRVTNYTKRNARQELVNQANQVKPGSKTKLGKQLDSIIEPISEHIKRISPRLYGQLKQIERNHFEKSHLYATMVDPFLSKAFPRFKPKLGIKGTQLLTADEQTYLQRMMLNSSNKENEAKIVAFLQQKGGEGLVKDYKLYREAMDSLHADRVAAGNVHLPKIIGYSPRRITSFKKWIEGADPTDKSAIEKILARNGTTLEDVSEETLKRVVSRYLSGISKEKNIQVARSAKERTRKEVGEGQLYAYEDPWHSTHNYIKESMEEIQRYKLFGTNNIDNMGDIDKTISNFITTEVKAGRIKGADVDALKELLTARFINGPKQMDTFLKKAKDVGYMTLLGHPTNAIRQFGDISLAAYQNGLKNTMAAVYQTMTKRMLTPKEMGLMDNIAEEFASDTATKRGLDFAFKYSGFRSVDALGKGSVMNSTINKFSKKAKTPKGRTEFLNEWGPILGVDDATKVLKELETFKPGKDKPTRLMRDMAFINLSKIQPVSLMEMPKAYLNHPNGRMLYMLKTFTVKHVNLMRQEIFKEFRAGNKTKAMKNLGALTTFFTLGNMGADKAIDLVLGKEDKQLEETFYANLWKNTGLFSKYDVDQLAKDGNVYNWITNWAKAPFDPLFEGGAEAVKASYNLARGEQWNEGMKRPGADLYQNIPLIGRIMKAYLVD